MPFEHGLLLGEVLHALHLGRDDCLGGHCQLLLLGRQLLFEHLFNRRYLLLLLLLDLGNLGHQLLLLFLLQLPFLPLNLFFLLEFELGDEDFVFLFRLSLLRFHHLGELLHQLFRILLALGLDLLEGLDRVLGQGFAPPLPGFLGRGHLFLQFLVLGRNLLDRLLALFLRGNDFIARVNHEHDRKHGEQIDHRNQCIDRFSLIGFGFSSKHGSDSCRFQIPWLVGNSIRKLLN